MPTGFFRLQTPLDLLAKMEADFQRLSTNRLDVYAAFDFFVGAHHLGHDWLPKAQCSPGVPKDARSAALEDICEHLAIGAKHFRPDPPYDAVDHTVIRPPAVYGLAVLGLSRFGDTTGALMIVLADDEARALDSASISAHELAGLVLTYWQAHAVIARARILFQQEDS